MMSSPKAGYLMRGVLLGTLFVLGAQGLQAATVERCNVAGSTQGVFVPVLDVKIDGKNHRFLIGEDGLSRAVIYDPTAALKWIAQKFGAEAAAADFKTCAASERSTNSSTPEDTPVVVDPKDDEETECSYSCESLAAMDDTQIGLADKFATL